MTSHLEDVPPPPYTETDIYSHSGGARSPISPVGHHHQDSSPGGAADDATQSTASTNGDVIYTPPLTPRSSHLSNFGGEADHLTVSSSAAYFETRPAPTAAQNLPQVVHSITIHANSASPGDLPYPAEFATSRDIRVEDWQTFINYLLPHHAAAANEHIIDRKLRAEGGSDASSTTSGHAEAQLDRIRGEQQCHAADASATVREWNEGFFAPRRVAIHLNVLEAEQQQQPRVQLPGAWDTSFDQPLPPQGQSASAPPQAGRSRFSRFPFWGGGAGGSGAGDARNGNGNGNGGFRFGGIAVEGDRVSIGERFVADRNGVRIGGIVADTNGISVNGQPMFGGGPLPGGRGCHGAFGHQHGGWGGRGFAGAGPWGRGQFSDWARARGGGDAGAAPPEFGCGRGRGRGRGRRGCDDEERGFGRGRGRGRHAHGGRHRSRDSSVSSESSSSSSSSESSVDSLPDYDDLKDAQLPVARNYLQTWLNHPDQPVTKEKLKQAKEQIKQARNTPNANPTNVTFDAKAMRKEIKAMIKEWKSLKKQQARTRKQLRRERRQKRRDEKREWRNTKREMRRAEREFRRGGGGHAPPHGFPFGAPAPPVPPMPAMAPMPPMPAVPPMPPIPSFMGMGGPRAGCAPHPMRATRSPPGPPWSPMGLGQLFGGWGGHTDVPGGQTQGTTNVGATTPGAWPGDNHGVDRHHEVSQAKYKAAMDIEARVIEKEAELLKLHEAIALEEEAKRTSGQSQKGDGDHKAQLGVEHGLETEIEELGRVMARLRTEADEEYARELAEEERRGGW